MSSSIGYLTFGEMKAEVGALAHSTSTARKTVIGQALNRQLDHIAAQFDWPQLTIADETGSRRVSGSVATFQSGEAEIPLPYSATDIRNLKMFYQDTSTDPVELVTSAKLFDLAGQRLNQQTRPRYCAIVGTTAQFVKLDSDDTLKLVSDTSGNDNSKTVRVVYVKSNALYAEPAVADITGAFSSGVSFPSEVLSGYSVKSITVPTGWQHVLRLQTSGGTNLSVIQSVQQPNTVSNDETRVISNALLRLWPVPDKDYNLTMVYYRRPRRMVDDDDVPEIPVSTYLVERAAAEILRQENKAALAQYHEREANNYIRAIIRQNSMGPQVAHLRRGSFLEMTGVEYPSYG